MFLEFCHWNHILKCVVQRLQVRVNLVAHVTRQETEFLAGLHCGAAEYDFPYLTVLQCPHCKCNGRVCLSCSGWAHCEYHVVLLELLDKTALVLAAWVDGAAVDVVDNDIAVASLIALLAVHGIYYCLLVEAVVFVAILLEQIEDLAEAFKLLFIAHGAYYVVARHNAQFRVQSLEHLQMHVACSVETYKVNSVKDKISLYHSVLFPYLNSLFSLSRHQSVLRLRRHRCMRMVR